MANIAPDFAQSIDFDRPHTLLTEDTKRSASLSYRYDDTGETVLVPNIWYNQDYKTRVAAVRWDAKIAEGQAIKYERHPPFDMTPADAADIARRYRERAARIHAEADRMEKAGEASHPVRASQMQLNYGDGPGTTNGHTTLEVEKPCSAPAPSN